MKFNITRGFILTLFFTVTSFAQIDRYDPDYEWYTIEREHIYVHFHEGAERTANVVARIAEEVWDPITDLYQYEPDKVHYVIKDIDDYSNGATYFFNNKIEIWSSALDFDLRGTHHWLRNVISHEFTHMVQIQAGNRFSTTIPSVYLQYLNYEDKRRPDILYGFPNFIASYPISGINVPAWFAEGSAQYMRKEFEYEDWDTHRDMILRSYALEDKMLSWNEMGVFSKTSLGSESVYNSGFALTRYISQKYGEDKIRDLSKQLGSPFNFTMNAAVKEVLGIEGSELYDEWSEYLKDDYKTRTASVLDNQVTGKKIADVGFGNFYPGFSDDGKSIIYVSNKEYDYFSLSSLYKHNIETGEEETVEDHVRSSTCFISGKNQIVYSKLSSENPKWIMIHDLYIYDLDEKEDTRITFGLRANQPSVSHDGKNIVFQFQKDGTTNIGLVKIDGKDFQQLTFFENGEQVYNPKFSPDDKDIYFGYSMHKGRDIARVNIESKDHEFVFNSEFDERTPVFSPDGTLYYCSDETGIFNIYRTHLNGKKSERITNVTGGAFMPDVNAEGDVVYAGYTAEGYKIFLLKSDEQKNIPDESKYVWKSNPPLATSKPIAASDAYNLNQLKNFNDVDLTPYEVKPYSGFFSKFSVFPFIRYDNYSTSSSGLDKIKLGFYVMTFDYLNKYSLFAGASLNRRMERDLFLNLEYRNRVPLFYELGLRPTFSLELYSISRKASVDLPFGIDSSYVPRRIDYNVPVDVTYDLFEFDLAAKHRIVTDDNNIELRFVYSQYSALLGSFIIPESNNTLYPSSNDRYFVGRKLQVKYEHEGLLPSVDADINPTGREIDLTYSYEFNKFNDNNEYEVEDGLLKPLYNDFNFHRVELNWKEHTPIFKDHVLTTQFRAASVLGPEVPDFFDFYLGGLIGMKSYPFYAINGNELGWLNLTYRFPLIKNIDTQIGNLYIDKIYFSVHGDFGNAWTGEFPGFSDFKKGAGAEIRIKMTSFYLFPTSIFFNASYSFDQFTREVRGENVTYGKEWRIYGGILFDFAF
ncbi:MAG: biopolymer transporter Tol [Bacteroidetes bacterium]|nr:biopolymer transporter Tol [Bacteroidota bacterium]